MHRQELNAQLPPDPAPEGMPPQGPIPDRNPPDVPQGPSGPSDPSGPTQQETVQAVQAVQAVQEVQEVQARHRSTQSKAMECANKSKRKKTNTIDCEQLFADVNQQLVHNISKPPPLLHTPHSMFEMLCHTFEQEFPDRLQQQVVDQILHSLREDA